MMEGKVATTRSHEPMAPCNVAVLIRQDYKGVYCVLGGVVYRPQRSRSAMHIFTNEDSRFRPGGWANFFDVDTPFCSTLRLWSPGQAEQYELWYAHGRFNFDLEVSACQAWEPA